MAFNSEKMLTDATIRSDFIKHICKSPYFIKTELDGLFGIPDLFIANISDSVDGWFINEAFAFEMKLNKWKTALKQAYRYKSFASKVYVVLDHQHSKMAQKNIFMFQKANVGLASIDDSWKIFVHYEPILDIPFSERMQQKLKTIINNNFFTDTQIYNYTQTIL